MSVAYVVIVHTAAHQVERLVRRLAGPEAAFFIHVDRKSPRSVHTELRQA